MVPEREKDGNFVKGGDIHSEIDVWSTGRGEIMIEGLDGVVGLFKDTVYRLSAANNVRWHCYLLRRRDGHVLRRELCCEFDGEWKKEIWKETLMGQIDKRTHDDYLSREDAFCQSKWIVGINYIELGLVCSPLFNGDATGF